MHISSARRRRRKPHMAQTGFFCPVGAIHLLPRFRPRPQDRPFRCASLFAANPLRRASPRECGNRNRAPTESFRRRPVCFVCLFAEIPIEEGHDLGAGAGICGREGPGGGALRDLLRRGPENRAFIIRAGIHVREEIYSPTRKQVSESLAFSDRQAFPPFRTNLFKKRI